MPSWPEARTALSGLGFHLAALALADDAVPLHEFTANRPERVAMLLGSEGDGLSARALRSADTIVTIPMEGGVDSLNVAAAAAVALWALRL
jgi:tRNA G18 (ribose-2'-O)-methylase SpoU